MSVNFELHYYHALVGVANQRANEVSGNIIVGACCREYYGDKQPRVRGHYLANFNCSSLKGTL